MKLFLQIVCVAAFTAPVFAFLLTKNKTWTERKSLFIYSFVGPVASILGFYLLSKWH